MQSLGFGLTCEDKRADDLTLERNAADHIGLNIMARACYDPREAQRMWERMEQVQKTSKVLAFVQTHPANADRIRKVRPLDLTASAGDIEVMADACLGGCRSASGCPRRRGSGTSGAGSRTGAGTSLTWRASRCRRRRRGGDRRRWMGGVSVLQRDEHTREFCKCLRRVCMGTGAQGFTYHGLGWVRLTWPTGDLDVIRVGRARVCAAGCPTGRVANPLRSGRVDGLDGRSGRTGRDGMGIATSSQATHRMQAKG